MLGDGNGRYNSEDFEETPPWLHLLTPHEQAWREKQISKGRDADSYIEQTLLDSGRWPEKDDIEASPADRT